jgi:hypothetical protein
MSLPKVVIPHLPALRASAELGNALAIRTLSLSQIAEGANGPSDVEPSIIAALNAWLKGEEEKAK